MANFPYVVTGTITDSGGNNPDGVTIVIRNDRTIETITVLTNSSGVYAGDLANLASGWNPGDQVTVIARYGLEDGESSFTTSDGEATQTVDITTSVILATSDAVYATITDVYNALDGKTSADIAANIVRDALVMAEGEIDVKTNSSFRENTTTDEFYDTNDFSNWSSAESLISGSGGPSRSDRGVTGGYDTFKVRNFPLISVTSLSKNTATTTEADAFTVLTEQDGSGGDFIINTHRSEITFINNFPTFGKKRALKMTYKWGLNRDSTDRKDSTKRELVRELCILIAVRQILTSKTSSSQFTSIDSISLESISISKNVGQSVTYLTDVQTRITQLYEILGTWQFSMGLI